MPRSFEDIHAANAQLDRWVLDIAGTRIHGTTGRQPLSVFEAEEKSALLPLPTNAWQHIEWKQAQVHRDCRFMFDRRLYPVPWRFIGKQVWVRAIGGSLEVYFDDTRIITHERGVEVPDAVLHRCLPEGRRELRYRSPSHWLERAVSWSVLGRRLTPSFYRIGFSRREGTMDDGREFRHRLEFVRQIDPDLAEKLGRAATLVWSEPGLSAVELRKFAERITRRHIVPIDGSDRRTLFEALRQARESDAAPLTVVDTLDAIRQAGNAGAHPRESAEERPTTDGILTLIREAWDSAVWLHEKLGRSPGKVPTYEAPTIYEGLSIFRDAVIGGTLGNGDWYAKYCVAKAIIADRDRRLRGIKDDSNSDHRPFGIYRRFDEI